MLRRSTILPLLAAALLAAGASPGHAATADTRVLLKTTRSWDGKPYPAYGRGQPQVTVLRIHIPAHSALGWHHHPAINAAYVQEGSITVEKRGEGGEPGASCSIAAGEVLPELVDQVHRGRTGAEPVTLIVFYAGTEGGEITVPDVLPAGEPPAGPAPPCRDLSKRP